MVKPWHDDNCLGQPRCAEQDPAKANPLTYARMGFCNLARFALKAGLTVEP